MRAIGSIASIGALLVVALPAEAQTGTPVAGTVTRVIDGDTAAAALAQDDP